MFVAVSGTRMGHVCKSDFGSSSRTTKETREESRGGAAPRRQLQASKGLFCSCKHSFPCSSELLSLPHRSSSPTHRQPLCSLYGWERDAGRGLPPCSFYCSVDTHNAHRHRSSRTPLGAYHCQLGPTERCLCSFTEIQVRSLRHSRYSNQTYGIISNLAGLKLSQTHPNAHLR